MTTLDGGLDALLDDATLVAVVGDIFAGLFGEDRGRPYETSHGQTYAMSSSVHVSGAWLAAIIVSCSIDFAQSTAAELFATDPGDVTDDDLRDVVGEIANVVGGNVKSIMPGPSALSLPVTTMGSVDIAPPNLDPASCLVLDLAWSGHAFRITVHSPPAPDSLKGQPL